MLRMINIFEAFISVRISSKSLSCSSAIHPFSSSTFSAGADLSTVYQLAKSGQRASIDEFIFHSLSRGITAPIYCSKPVACSLNGHTIAGGLMLALACDYIAIGTQKSFRMGITGSIVGIPYPIKAVKLVQHQLEPRFAYRLLIDGQIFPSDEFPLHCDRGDNPDQLATQWLSKITIRPLKAFEISKKKWWFDYTRLDCQDNNKEKNDYFQAVTSNQCLQAMEKALTKS